LVADCSCEPFILQLGLFSACGMGSPGLDELRWLRPVRPGDALRSEVNIVDVRPSRSKPDRGMLVMGVQDTHSPPLGASWFVTIGDHWPHVIPVQIFYGSLHSSLL
jgi:hypothetical protein